MILIWLIAKWRASKAKAKDLHTKLILPLVRQPAVFKKRFIDEVWYTLIVRHRPPNYVEPLKPIDPDQVNKHLGTPTLAQGRVPDLSHLKTPKGHDLYLHRQQFRSDGIFGQLCDTNGRVIALTLEHAYPNTEAYAQDGYGAAPHYYPKVPPGTYRCVRGLHRLAHMEHDFKTFEVMGVKGHTGILLHKGNSQNDSSGCILLGSSFGPNSSNTAQVLYNSTVAFNKFMNDQENVDSFTLEVT